MLAVFGFLVGPASLALSLYAVRDPMFDRLSAWCAVAGAIILTVGSIGRLILHWNWSDTLTHPENLEPHQRLLAWVVHRRFLLRRPSRRRDHKILAYVLPSSRQHHDLCYQALRNARNALVGSGWKAPALVYPDIPNEFVPGNDFARYVWLDPSERLAVFRIPVYAFKEGELATFGDLTLWSVRSNQWRLVDRAALATVH